MSRHWWGSSGYVEAHKITMPLDLSAQVHKSLGVELRRLFLLKPHR